MRGRGQHASGEQQRVARQEESDEQTGLGEQHDRDADRPERGQQRMWVEQVQRQRSWHVVGFLRGVRHEMREGRVSPTLS